MFNLFFFFTDPGSGSGDPDGVSLIFFCTLCFFSSLLYNTGKNENQNRYENISAKKKKSQKRHPGFAWGHRRLFLYFFPPPFSHSLTFLHFFSRLLVVDCQAPPAVRSVSPNSPWLFFMILPDDDEEEGSSSDVIKNSKCSTCKYGAECDEDAEDTW